MWTASLDSVKELADFAEKQELPFGLLSDPDGSVATKYGVLDPSGRFAQRVTFLLDETGKLRGIEDQVDVKNHGMDLAERVVVLKETK